MILSFRKILNVIIYVSLSLISYSQSLSERDIKELGQKINSVMKGMDLGEGMSIRGCFALGRTLIYQYEVNEFWYPTANMKELLIENIKTTGNAELYYQNDVNVEFQYFLRNRIVKNIKINSYEFASFFFELGDFIDLSMHPKAKGISLKIKPPTKWEVKEGDRPNIVKKFVYQDNSYMIINRDNYTFLSRNESNTLLNDKEFVDKFTSEALSIFENPEVISNKIVTVDRYPSIELKFKGSLTRQGLKFDFFSKIWIVIFEDKFVFLQGMGISDKETEALERVFDMITNSVIFPEQYTN